MENTKLSSRKYYLSKKSPGSKTNLPKDGLSSHLTKIDPNKEESEVGYNNFVVIKYIYNIYSTLNKDIYSIFSSIDNQKQIAFLKIMINPLVRWVWIGGYILVFGTLIALWPRKEE